MRYFALLLAGALAFSACHHTGESSSASSETTPTASDSLKAALADQDSLLALMNDVAEGMSQIKQMENILSSSGNLTNESRDQRQ
ncbi:MAG: hypothetical protein K2K36_01525, partial [Muribaculaceae bacterium]|nr:hypothetical protein [Muribaculaceae bacterium]